MMNSKARILVVDDDLSIRKTVSLILAQVGYVTDTAETGEEAIAKSDANYYNLALIDYRLPDMAGTKLLTLLKETVPKMMKVILTGYPVLDNAIEAINRGVDGYLTKPVNADRLLKTVGDLLNKQLTEQEYTEKKVLQYVNTRFKYGRTVRRENDDRVVRRELPI